jgi:hypothetical protein
MKEVAKSARMRRNVDLNMVVVDLVDVKQCRSDLDLNYMRFTALITAGQSRKSIDY